MFLTLADENGKAELEQIKKSNDVFKKIDAIHHALINGRVPSEPLSAAQWFGLFTTKLNLLHQLGKSMIARIRETDEPHSESTKQAALAEESKAAIETGVRAYMDRIVPLPLFAGLDDATVQDILKYARITNHAKGAMIFMQGEQPSRFYIILEGWVKLFKGNIEGEESILQVLGVGDNLLETVIFSDASLPVNAQAVDSVKLLSIPASILREKLRQNNTLAVNMLSTVSGRSQALISQFEQLTLKTVTQRVGWFLLKLFLESGDRTSNLKLPYDKSLIAGYLGMKPETFSRTLQALKERGIDIEKNSVNLPDVFALCDFCDPEVAERCTRHHTPECPNPQCLD
jgi:CRP-like cAMP-binding protein